MVYSVPFLKHPVMQETGGHVLSLLLRLLTLSYDHPVDQSKGPHTTEGCFFSLSCSGRQKSGSQPLHKFLSKLLIRFVKGITPLELHDERALKARPQQ